MFVRDRRRARPPFPEPGTPVTHDADPALIRDAHHFLLDRVGREMGYAFHPQPSLEAPSEKRIVVFGRFDRRARQREFGLQLRVEEVADGSQARVAWLIDYYILERRRRQGFGTRLMDGLLGLWVQAGVVEARLTSTGEALPAYESWGFVADDGPGRLGAGLQPMRLKLR